MCYFYTDHLGLIVAVTDEVGNVVQRYSYDAWGRWRNAGTWAYEVSPPSHEGVGATDRGYTGHEHLDEFGLINMNGRVYDPVLGMFLSPDNYIQSPTDPLNYNRYSYGLNTSPTP